MDRSVYSGQTKHIPCHTSEWFTCTCNDDVCNILNTFVMLLRYMFVALLEIKIGKAF